VEEPSVACLLDLPPEYCLRRFDLSDALGHGMVECLHNPQLPEIVLQPIDSLGFLCPREVVVEYAPLRWICLATAIHGDLNVWDRGHREHNSDAETCSTTYLK